MTKTKQKKIIFLVLCTIFAAILCRNVGRELPGRALGLLRSLLYVGLFTAWGISLRRRVMQPQARQFLTSIAGLVVFWLMVRTVKYFFVSSAAIRYLWYFFYLPMLFIPLFTVFVAASLDKPENYRIPGWTKVLYFLAGMFFLLVLSNDLHQLVFTFDPTLTEWRDSGYTYGTGYYAVIGFMGMCALSAIVIMIYKCRATQGKKAIWTPLLFLPAAAAYCILYAIYIEDHTSLLYYLAGDMTVVNCLLFAGLMESCLQAGLIPTNTGYDALFQVSSVGMQITDQDYHICYTSDAARHLSAEVMCSIEGGKQLLDGATLFKSHSIRGGYIVWQEDVSELIRVKDELESIREELQDRNDILREQYRQDAQRYKLEEQNRLYDLVQRETQRQLRQIDTLAAQRCGTLVDMQRRRELLLRILVLATYVKRRKDMIISADRSRVLSVGRLSSALREFCSNLSISGIAGNLYLLEMEAVLPIDAAHTAYDLFEDALELSLDTLSYFFVTIVRKNGTLSLHVNLECAVDLSLLARRYAGAVLEQDDSGWFLTQKLEQGGEDG